MIFSYRIVRSCLLNPRNDVCFMSVNHVLWWGPTSPFFSIFTRLPLHLPSIGFYFEQFDKEFRREGDSNGITLFHVLFGQHSSEKYEFYPPPRIQKTEGFRGGKWDPNQLKENQVKWTLTRKTSYFLSLGEILPSVQAHVNSSLNFWKSIFLHKYWFMAHNILLKKKIPCAYKIKLFSFF